MREYELEVLEQYDIEVISTRKTRGAYFCNTKDSCTRELNRVISTRQTWQSVDI